MMKLIQHIGLIHARKANFTITCGLNDCQSIFTKYEPFRRFMFYDDNEVAHDVSDEPRTDTVIANPPSMDELLLSFKEKKLLMRSVSHRKVVLYIKKSRAEKGRTLVFELHIR